MPNEIIALVMHDINKSREEAKQFAECLIMIADTLGVERQITKEDMARIMGILRIYGPLKAPEPDHES